MPTHFDPETGDEHPDTGAPCTLSVGCIEYEASLPRCAETGNPVEFRTTHDYRTDARWRYDSGAVCTHRVIRSPRDAGK